MCFYSTILPQQAAEQPSTGGCWNPPEKDSPHPRTKEMGIPDDLTCLLRYLYAGQKKKQSELDMEQWSGSKVEKGYIKAVYCQPAYLTYM